jgi:predicted Zn-dependent protease
VERLVAKLPQSEAVRMLAATTYINIDDSAEAVSTLKRALEMNGNNFAAYAMLARIYGSQHRTADARAELQNLLTRQPQNVAAETLLGMLYEQDGMKAEARNAYEHVLSKDPDSPIAANNLAWLLVDANTNLPRAIELATAARRRLPESPTINDTLGWAYFRSGQTGPAVAALEDAARRDGKNAATLLRLSQAYAADGQYTRSRETLQQAIAIKPELRNQPDVQKALARPY